MEASCFSYKLCIINIKPNRLHIPMLENYYIIAAAGRNFILTKCSNFTLAEEEERKKAS